MVIRETLRRLVRRLRVPEALKFVAISFSRSYFFIIKTEARLFLVLYGGLDLLEFKIKNLSGLISRRLI